MRRHPRDIESTLLLAQLHERFDAVRERFPDLCYDQDLRALTQVLEALLSDDPTVGPTDPLAQAMLVAVRARPDEGTAPLTVGEIVAFLGQQIGNNARYLIRLERHGTADRPGGLA